MLNACEVSLPPKSPGEVSGAAALPPYAELHCLSNFTFLRGASHPHELVEQADALGYAALAITDECSVAGVVRAHMAAKHRRLKLVIGSEFRLECGLTLVALAIDRRGYGRLCRLITRGRRAADKGRYSLTRADLEAASLAQCYILWVPAAQPSPSELRWLAERFPGRLRIAVELLREGGDRERLAALEQLGAHYAVPLLASGDVHMHVRARRRLQDALTAIRLKVPVAEAGLQLYGNGERYLRERARLARLYPRELLEAAVELSLGCTFSLDELRYEYPRELVPPGETPASYLRRLTYEGARWRWPGGVPESERTAIEHELALIAELRYEPYFLTVQDVVAYARRQGILCQGRGSAANSRVCYCLGVTSVDPQRGATLLFERFISRERNEPPDIDIDFEHERREEVLQYVYRKYGRERAALAATVIMYRPRSALRDLGKVFGLTPAESGRLAKVMQWWDRSAAMPERVRDAGFDPESSWLARLLPLASELVAFPGFPRHLSQHVGGFVISEGALEELVPIENAAMPERTVVQWDKDDLNDLRLLKVDLLALGMLTALKRAFALVKDFRGTRHALGELPAEDPRVYAMISRADTIGVFQIESRAQMAMLPRLKPQCYYDLVIEVAIVRPGPIQGDMVHPYLRRRSGAEPVEYPSEEVREVLERTLGVPIFQEQVMKIAIVAAGFSPGEADALRRAMGAWKRTGGLDPFRERLLEGMRAKGYPAEFAQRIYRQMLGFGEYGFPLAHAALRAAGVRLRLAQVLRARGLHLRAAQQSAHGLLCAGAAGERRARPRRRGAGGGCLRERVGCDARAARGRGTGAAAWHAAGEIPVTGGCDAAARGAHPAALCERVGSGRPRGARPRGPRGSGRGRSVGLPERQPAASAPCRSALCPHAVPISRRAGRCSPRPPKPRPSWRTTPRSGSPSGAIRSRCCASASPRRRCFPPASSCARPTARRCAPPASCSCASALPPRAASPFSLWRTRAVR